MEGNHQQEGTGKNHQRLCVLTGERQRIRRDKDHRHQLVQRQPRNLFTDVRIGKTGRNRSANENFFFAGLSAGGSGPETAVSDSSKSSASAESGCVTSTAGFFSHGLRRNRMTPAIAQRRIGSSYSTNRSR